MPEERQDNHIPPTRPASTTLKLMKRFIQLAEAQSGHTTDFSYIDKSGEKHNMEISVHAACAMVWMDGKHLGSVDYSSGEKLVLFGWGSLMHKMRLQLFVDQCEQDNSLYAFAWKQGILERFQKRVYDAHNDLGKVSNALSDII